ncbi:MAG: hypothetical protein E4H43_01555, partial [Bacteroidia bacterium]
MPEYPNNLVKFWQELKRRKVFKVVTMYAGTAFIILEVVNKGLELADKALETDPDTEGWGLNKQGKY